MILAAEDRVTERLGLRLIGLSKDVASVRTIVKGGRDRLQASAKGLNQTAAKIPVVIVADLDTPVRCMGMVVQRFLGGNPSRHMICRFAVLEGESWVLADRRGFATYFGVAEERIPTDTDSIESPKEMLVTLCRRYGRPDVRLDVVPLRGSTATVGPLYNARLAEFIDSHWSPRRAARYSASLKRALSYFSA